MPNKNARVIIPLVLVSWLLGIVIFRGGVPGFVQGLFIIAFVITVLLVVFYLMADMGWSALAATHRAVVPFKGAWNLASTVHVSRVSVRDPEYERSRMRFLFMLRIAVSDHGLYLSTLLSLVPILGLFFPTLQIPWSAVTTARTYEAPGWVAPVQEPGTILQVGYDPNYTGTFVELEVGRPPVFIQLPLHLLGEAASRLRLAGAD